MTEFTREFGVSTATLHEWRRRLGPTGSEVCVAAAPTRLVEVEAALPFATNGSAFVPRLAAGGHCIEVARSSDAVARWRLIAVVVSC